MSLPLSQTSLKGEHLSFRTHTDIYFEIEITDYNREKQEITVAVTDYQPVDYKRFNTQEPKAQVRFIHFEPLRWQNLEKHLSSYTKKPLLKNNIVYDDAFFVRTNTGKQPATETINITGEDKQRTVAEQSSGYTTQKIQTPVIKTIKENGKIYFADAVFDLGFISCDYKSKSLKGAVNLKIVNTYLLPEFNAIKYYFPKVFGGKKQFSVNITITLTDDLVTDIVTRSPEIEQINENMLDSVKRLRVFGLTKPPIRIAVDKSFFTSADIFDSFEEQGEDGNIFNQSEQDILNMLVEKGNIRNARQLQYLSGSKHSSSQKIRFTLKPDFGFIFFIEGETRNHFCWELLNSHATYLWSVDKIASAIPLQFRRIEEIINTIRDMGREAYKQHYRNNSASADILFTVIEHSHIGSALKDGFVEWQHRLKERLV